MKDLFLLSLIAQTGLMGVDEFHFHWKRNLPKWERWGHPVDTLSFLFPFSVLAFASPGTFTKWVYVLLSVLSCAVITKDEWIHQNHALPGEQWLHSVLFILHPVVLISAYLLWVGANSGVPFVYIWFSILAFLVYQLLFWNYYADRLFKKRFIHHQQ